MGGIGHPAVALGFFPARAVHADLVPGRERTLGHLAVDGGLGQSGSGLDGLHSDDTVWFAHGRGASCWLFLIAAETRQTRHGRARKMQNPGVRGTAAIGYKSDGSDTDAASKVETVAEGQRPAKAAA